MPSVDFYEDKFHNTLMSGGVPGFILHEFERCFSKGKILPLTNALCKISAFAEGVKK